MATIEQKDFQHADDLKQVVPDLKNHGKRRESGYGLV